MTTERVRRCISSAMARARTVWMLMLMTTYLNVTHSAFQNRASWSICW